MEEFAVVLDAGDGADLPDVVWTGFGFAAGWDQALALAGRRAPAGARWASRRPAPGPPSAQRAASPRFTHFVRPGRLGRGRVAPAAVAGPAWLGVFGGGALAWYSRPIEPRP